MAKAKADPKKARSKAAENPKDEEAKALETYRGEDGSKSPGFALHPPKPGIPTDADDAGRGGEDLV